MCGDYVLTGVAIGLATSSKYTGLLLLVPFAAALVVVRLQRRKGPRARDVMVALLLVGLTFVVTSPYVLLDWQKFRADFALEREHMKLGHFGQGDASTMAFYARALVRETMNVVCGVAALLGVLFLVFRRKERAAIVLAVFVAAYLGLVGTWSMQASRYLLPSLPLLLIFAAAVPLPAMRPGRMPGVLRSVPVWAALLAGVLVVPNLASLVDHVEEIQHDTRTDAQEWVESNASGGSFIVGEAYGPNLLGAQDLLSLSPQLMERVVDKWRNRPVYATQLLPMVQTFPERSAKYYSFDLYPNADYFITSGAVRRRYERDPGRYSAHVAFYRRLDREYYLVKRFVPRQRGGSELRVYRRESPTQPFGMRKTVAPPPSMGDQKLVGLEANFYFGLGANYEYFRHLTEALASYQLALGYGTTRELFLQSVMGQTRCLLALGRAPDAIRFIDETAKRMPDEPSRRFLMSVSRALNEGLRDQQNRAPVDP